MQPLSTSWKGLGLLLEDKCGPAVEREVPEETDQNLIVPRPYGGCFLLGRMKPRPVRPYCVHMVRRKHLVLSLIHIELHAIASDGPITSKCCRCDIKNHELILR